MNLYEYARLQVKKELPTQTPRKWGFDIQGKIVISLFPYKSQAPPSSKSKYSIPLKKFLYGYLEDYKSLKPISLSEGTWEDLIYSIVD